jgi:hypothetical protein
MQNTSHAVMAQRVEPKASLDDFPTPPWATRALIEHVLRDDTRQLNCLEPACGEGHMVKVLREYFGRVDASDIADYGFAKTADFLTAYKTLGQYDWIITNPPFNLAEKFVNLSLEIATRGVAILVRTVFIESVGRYERLFRERPPSVFAQFVERVPMVKGRLDPKASTATGYSWLIWTKNHGATPRLLWIPPCRRQLERPGDYPGWISSRASSSTKLLRFHPVSAE